jgi:SAM-dependent methyltransferase
MKRKKGIYRVPKGQFINLDVGCGLNKTKGYVGMDIRKVKGVDIVHDVESVPYPLSDGCCNMILMSHLIEHICPKRMIHVMNELWRIMKVGGHLYISTPYAGSRGCWQDPTHCGHWNETTPLYFDPYPYVLKGERSILYDIYKAKPWQLREDSWFATGNLQIIYEKRRNDEKGK